MAKQPEYEDDEDIPKELLDTDELEDLDEEGMDMIGKEKDKSKPNPSLPIMKGQEQRPAVKQPKVKAPAMKEVLVENPEVEEPKTEEQQAQDIGQYILAKLQELEDRITRMESYLFQMSKR